ncbi:gamma-glutamyl-gamma-aminobutyrate hydrolase family protein [Aquisalinus flavus]|uniref:Anthranilate synthase component II n=1 Tax=Aquisalinus flavus TaxID=1526572 RepID=A0A8J2V7S1_9PROT|nr:gamma-glutamyl-gamma-aminobutyrate hydrolase family protein [Aquisalinus flavus]MBD0425569.1 gamma-glutamyl-gamma-aminobutyrate hydrolase family protein [Aquisalinus flavus]UNE48807.1 gamma-glutamyl-gamma-aminobutyrate hydrolase family protein [Aquisalinus flavus]GGD15004.1 anthranilate synthase component II [Aquisalinus flavus]
MSRPCIGITKPEMGDNAAYRAIRLAVMLAGGETVNMNAGTSWREMPLDGLIVGGGSDIFPEHYDAEAIETATYDHGRDEMEMYWARRAREENVPVLGICRGAQLLNVAHGGSLHHDLAGTYENAEYPTGFWAHTFFRKTINVEQGSLLAGILGTRRTQVNSLHRKAIDRVGDGLRVTAREENGIVQAIEDPTRRFYLGVQFHPEFLIYRSRFMNLFRRLVEAARADRPAGDD